MAFNYPINMIIQTYETMDEDRRAVAGELQQYMNDKIGVPKLIDVLTLYNTDIAGVEQHIRSLDEKMGVGGLIIALSPDNEYTYLTINVKFDNEEANDSAVTMIVTRTYCTLLPTYTKDIYGLSLHATLCIAIAIVEAEDHDIAKAAPVLWKFVRSGWSPLGPTVSEPYNDHDGKREGFWAQIGFNELVSGISGTSQALTLLDEDVWAEAHLPERTMQVLREWFVHDFLSAPLDQRRSALRLGLERACTLEWQGNPQRHRAFAREWKRVYEKDNSSRRTMRNMAYPRNRRRKAALVTMCTQPVDIADENSASIKRVAEIMVNEAGTALEGTEWDVKAVAHWKRFPGGRNKVVYVYAANMLHK